MEYTYIALALNSMGEEINEVNIKKMLAVMNQEPDEAELRALMTLITALQRGEIKKEAEQEEDQSSLIRRLEKIEAKVLNLEKSLEELQKLTSPEPTKVYSPKGSVKSEIKEKEEPAVQAEKKASSSAESVKSESQERTTVSSAKLREAESVISRGGEGRYLYGIANRGETISLGKIGIEGSAVYTIPYKDICAIVHNCPLEPYVSEDNEKVKEWVKSHQRVLDVAKERFDTILPLGFDTIIQPKDNADSTKVVKDWLKEDYQNYQTIIKKIKRKEEYGVQISYDPQVISEQISKQSEEIKKIKEEMASKSPGMAYMYKQKLENIAKQEMDKLADKYFEEFYGRIKKCAEEIKVEKTKKVDKNKIMMMNLSCLVTKEKVEELGNELEKINNMEGLSVHFSGPWPPYSFVDKPTTSAEGSKGSKGK